MMRNQIENISKHHLGKFYNLKKGKDCYIFGTGPSIKWYDLKNFSNKESIVTGLLPFHREFSSLNVSYYSLIEPWLLVNHLLRNIFGISEEQEVMISNQEELIEIYKEFLEENNTIDVFLNASNILNLSCIFNKKIHFTSQNLPNKNVVIDKLNNFNLFSGSFHAPIVLAYFLGFEEINLVGFDAWTLRKSRSTRFYEVGKGDISFQDQLDDDIFNIINNEITINIISPFEDYSFSRIQKCKTIFYEDLFSTKAIYRENNDLVSEKVLNALSADPILNVY